MIKVIEYKYECQSCGTIFQVRRHLFIEELDKNITLPKNIICACGTKKKFKLLDINIPKEEI